MWIRSAFAVGALAMCAECCLAQTDWDLYMLRLVNRARHDSAGEPARIGSAVMDSRLPLPPLAYHLAVGLAATNHNNWMNDNFGNISSGAPPDSFTHFETLNGLPDGTPAMGTPSYTGVGIGDRLTAAGFSRDRGAENISAAWSSATIPVNQARIDANHKGWWESTGHRNSMLSTEYTVFGHRAESRTFVPPRGGLGAPFDNLHYATQNFARPSAGTKTFILGVLFDDKDANGAWTPRQAGDAQREGLGGVTYQVLNAAAATLVTSGTTMANGAFSAQAGSGTYDVVLLVPSLPGGKLTVEGVVLAGQNVDAGDHDIRRIVPADLNGDRHVDLDDYQAFLDCSTGAAVPYAGGLPAACTLPLHGAYVAADFDADGDVDADDFGAFQRCYSGVIESAPPACPQ